MITLAQVSKSFGSRTLFEDVNITFNPGQRYGLTGPNGAGKSTLLKMIMGLEEVTSGSITLPDKVGILRQNIEDYLEMRVMDVVIMGNRRLWAAMSERDRLYEGEMTDAVGMRLGELETIVAEEDGYSAESNAEILLEGMGIGPEYHNQLMNQIPTDLQFRALICQALFGEPQALLLDEPTNHLDLESIGWLENFLHSFTGAMVVISHDRHFLNSVCTHIADIDYETVISYPGNYDDMITAKTATRSRAEQDAKSKEKKIAQLKEFVAKFSAGTRATQVQSRLREIQRIQPQALKASNIQRPYIRFPLTEKAPGKTILKVNNISKSYDGLEVIKNFSYEISRGDKIGIIGNNGRGKTTLVRMLAQVMQPDKGTVELGHQVERAYFPQNHSDVIEPGETRTAFDWLKNCSQNTYDQDIRGVMGKMLFGGDDAFKKVGSLSGGETARVLMASMMLQQRNFIVLDEPNGHLDLESVSALAWSLEEYGGTVVVVSHDRDLIASVCNRIIAFEADGIHCFDGTLDEYLQKRNAMAGKK